MKRINVAIAIALALICILGWSLVFKQQSSKSEQYSAYVEQADIWVEEGLYQRAIQSYQMALTETPAVDIYTKAVGAYQKRISEVSGDILDDTLDEYTDFLTDAVADCPQVEEFVRLLAELYLNDEKYTQAYSCLRTAVNNGIYSDNILSMLRQAQYAWSYRGGTYSSILPLAGATYSVEKNGAWGAYEIENGSVLPCEYEYVSQSNTEDILVVTINESSRLIEAEGIVLGIFDQVVVDAGVYSDGLIPATFDGTNYQYFDEFANPQFGGFEEAGTFQDGTAAVKQDGVWFLINDSDEKISDEYDEIILNARGEYLSDNVMLAAKEQGHYCFYDKDMKELSSFEADEVDILTADGIVAYCQNGKWGFVDRDGNTVIEPQYTMARSFSFGIAAVCKDNIWGFVDREGNVVIDFQFANALYFDEQGTCPVRIDQPPLTFDEVMGAVLDSGSNGTSNTDETVQEGNADVDMEIPTEGTNEISVVEEWKLLKLKIGIAEE